MDGCLGDIKTHLKNGKLYKVVYNIIICCSLDIGFVYFVETRRHLHSWGNQYHLPFLQCAGFLLGVGFFVLANVDSFDGNFLSRLEALVVSICWTNSVT